MQAWGRRERRDRYFNIVDMANSKHLEILMQGEDAWNEWRKKEKETIPDLQGADLSGMQFDGVDFNDANLVGVNFSGTKFFPGFFQGANLEKANFQGALLLRSNFHLANLKKANFIKANLQQSILCEADLSKANLSKAGLLLADLSSANLSGAILNSAFLGSSYCVGTNFRNAKLKGAVFVMSNLTEADLSFANLTNSNLCGSILVGSNLSYATISNSRVYGISTWSIEKKGLIQDGLVITQQDEPEITVDDLEIAQFIYLIINNKSIRNVIDTLTSKAVLILGRFSQNRKPLLNAIRNELRSHNYLPILFDFEKPASKDLDETINLLARMSRFVIADITDAKSIPQELKGFVESNPSVPVFPMIIAEQHEYALFSHFIRYPWVLPVYRYEDPQLLLDKIHSVIIEPVERKIEEIINQSSRLS